MDRAETGGREAMPGTAGGAGGSWWEVIMDRTETRGRAARLATAGVTKGEARVVKAETGEGTDRPGKAGGEGRTRFARQS